MYELCNAVKELTTAVKELASLIYNRPEESAHKPLTPEEAAAFLTVPLGTFRHWQTEKRLKPMTGLSSKHPRYEKEYLLKLLKDGFVVEQMAKTRSRLNKRRAKQS